MIFVANGTGAFTLAVGRDNVRGVQTDVSQVALGFSARELLALERAVAGPLDEQRAASARGRVGRLWGALLLGVAVLGATAWALVRQMNNPAAPGDSAGGALRP